MKKIVVAGAGTMGLEIGALFARGGLEVAVRDISDEIIARARGRLESGLDRQVKKGSLTEGEREAALGRISLTTDIGVCSDADLVLEAIVERLEVKRGVFKELDEICKPETIFASNTSSISITDIGAATGRQDRFIGMHFFNPPGVMKLVEVIRGANTSDETVDAVLELARAVGKDPVMVEEAPGFVVNKLLVPMINDAIGLVETGVATAEDVDKAMRLGANHPMGPLALGDLIGLDVCLAIMESIFGETGDPKYRPCLLLRKMVRGGRLGRKSGRGFYDYT